MTIMNTVSASSVLLPRTDDEVRSVLLDAIAGQEPIRICGADTWRNNPLFFSCK